MQSFRVAPRQQLGGDIHVPGDKSISHRALMLGAIARGTTRVQGFLDSEDCRATLAAFEQMGVHVRRDANGSIEIEGRGQGGLETPQAPIDMGNSGTGLRLLMGLLAGQRIAAELTGDASLTKRPMERIAVPLRRMGAAVTTSRGTPPVRIGAGSRLNGIEYELPVASAQIKSALLLAALGAQGLTRVIAPAVTRDHTERMLRTMGVAVDSSDDGLSVAIDGPVAVEGAEITVPGDLSSAAFFIVGACLAAEEPLTIRNVGINPTRQGILTILKLMGARIEIENRRQLGAEPVADLRVRRARLTGIDVPEALVPLAIDELPILFVAAAAARGKTVVSGAAELRVKESDRISVMARALQAVGVRTEEKMDGLVIEGGEIAGGTIDSEGDHRVAMALVIASLVSRGPIVVRDTAPVATSFPQFVDVAADAHLAIAVGED